MNMQTFFLFCPQYEGSVNEVLFFVTNVKTQTFYRIVQFFSAFLGGIWRVFFSFRKKGVSHLSTCVVFRIVPAYVVVLLSFQMKIYMNIYEDNTSLKLQVWFKCLSSTYFFLKYRYICLFNVPCSSCLVLLIFCLFFFLLFLLARANYVHLRP